MTTPDPVAKTFGERDFSLWRMVPAVFAPALIMEIGIGAILPVIASRTTTLGGSLAMAGFMSALLPVGQILGDLPAGVIAARIGDRRALMWSAAGAFVALLACAFAPNLWLLGLALTALGAVNATFLLARQSYLTEITPVMKRARALSTLAGLQRVGYFIGPFAGAALIALVGHEWGTRAVFMMAMVLALGVAVLVAFTPEPSTFVKLRTPTRVSTWQVIVAHRHIFATLGIGIFAVGAARGARQVVLPLWTEHLGMTADVTSLVFGLSGAMDMALFYVSGKIMDRYGRLWVAVPSMILLGAGLIALPFTTTLVAVSLVAALVGLGNGIGSGVLMTLGADTAPGDIRAQFLAVWRVVQDTGNAVGPLVVSGAAAVGSLAAGIWSMGAVSMGAAAAMAKWVPRWSVHANRRTRLAAGIEVHYRGRR